MEAGENSNTGMSVRVSKEHKMIRIENPFTLKVGQVFTGFGIGCGVGIGVGRPLNLGAVPVLNQVMAATKGATDAFSGVGRHLNGSLRKLGAKNIEAGIGCGMGFGHGFGVGLAVKPGVLQQIQSCVTQGMIQMMMKFGLAPNVFLGQGALSAGMQNVMNTKTEPLNQNPIGNIMKLATKVPDETSQGNHSTPVTSLESFASKGSEPSAFCGSRTEKVINNFLHKQFLKDEDGESNEQVGRLQSENNMLKMVLKHQQIIEELMEENEKLRQILVEDLKVPENKLQGRHTSRNKSLSCSECFECRRKQRKK